MNKNVIVLAISSAVLAVAAYSYTASNGLTATSNDKPTLRKLKRVEPAVRNPLKDRNSQTCPAHKKNALRLLHNGGKVWKKSHDDFFKLEQIQTFDHRRLKGRKDILPLEALYTDYENIQFIDFITCANKTSTLRIEDINNSKEPYFLGQNNKGMMKLMRRDDKPRYKTVFKSIIEINLRDE